MQFRSHFSPTLINVSLRFLRRHVWQTGLMVLGVAIGVAVVIGMDMANESARRAFNLATVSLTGRTTHSITAGSKGVAEDVYVDLRLAGLDIPLSPVVSDYLSSPQMGSVTIQVFGLDPFVDGPFRDFLPGVEINQDVGLSGFLTQPGGILISEDLAMRYGLKLGNHLQLEYSGKMKESQIGGILKPEDNLSKRAMSGLIIMDIASAQELTGRVGVLDRIDLILPDDESMLQRIQSFLPAETLVMPAASQNGIVEEMTAAFQLNLTALSLLAMVVALFLIYNTMTFSVVQRREMFGVLRCLGVTRKEVFLLVIVEALVVGFIGVVLGTGLGILMGRGSVRMVTQTINDLFFVTTVQEFPVPLFSLLKGNLLGILATVITAAFPAWEASNVTPRIALSRSGIESKFRVIVPWAAVMGIALNLVGLGILWISADDLLLSFLSTFFIVIGQAMLTPLVMIWFMGGLTRLAKKLRSPMLKMAPREVVNAISRTAIAVAALMIAVAVTIGVSLMINSFRGTVVTWLDQILHGDIYISVPGASVSQPTFPIDPGVVEFLRNNGDVSRMDLLQTATVNSPNGAIQVSANNNPNDGLEQIYKSVDHPVEEIDHLLQQGAVLVSEPLANRLGLPDHGGVISLYTPLGLKKFPIAGIYYDYASSSGTLIMSLEIYRQIWQDQGVTAAALLLKPGIDVDKFAESLKQDLSSIQRLLIRPNSLLRAETLAIFDRTFAITSAMQLMTTFVAFVGVLSAMMSLQFDKKRQLGILRAIGLTTRQLWRLVGLETGLMGLIAGIYAIPVGTILTLILIYIINLRSFGWTLQIRLDIWPYLQGLMVAVAASLLAGIYPAWRIMKGNTAETIRFE